jgi:4-alpha-glucanotransferase
MSQKTEKPTSPRSAGVLLHPTSLPGPYGIGDLGQAAYTWIDALVYARQTWWQILPLGPTGYGDSPYQSFCSFAGNPLLVSPQRLVDDGLLTPADVVGPHFPPDRVDFGAVIAFKSRLLRQAWERFEAGAAHHLRPEFDAFCTAEKIWLDDYALFRVLKETHDGKSWLDWPAPLRLREPEALAAARHAHAQTIGRSQFTQFLFFRQWRALKAHAARQGIKLIGDVPIFVAIDSVDVWANPDLFLLDEERRPTVVAGVPPDYFAATGQLWGNPIYDWDALEATGYAWWIARVKATLGMVDFIRLDHFRGFEAAWHVHAGMPTAQVGAWKPGPRLKFFDALRRTLGALPLIAEDLGVITPEVEQLRDDLHLPGMRILQFAFGGATENRFLPHHYDKNTVVYTGTHDNDTTRGWYESIKESERDLVRRYLGRTGTDATWDLIRLAWMSVADYAIVPLQDLLDLGTEARMNLPGRPSGNWGWRFTADQLTVTMLDRLRDLTELYSREPAPPAKH